MNVQDPRKVFGETLVELGKANERIVVLEADLGKSTMSAFFQQAFPERYFEMGISEQNMTSFAAGLAVSGKIAVVNSFAVFATGRSFDQLRQSICTANLNVKIDGSSAGLSDFGDGATHQAVEDIAIMRALPNMTVLVPMDGVETKKIVKAAIEHKGPVYLRIGRTPVPDYFPEKVDFKIGEPTLIKEGKDVVIFACGQMVALALSAAFELEKETISVKVINVSSLKPINENAIKEFAKGVKGIITAEEHSIIGGLASVICYILRGSGIPVEPIAIMDKFGQSAMNQDELLQYYGLTKNDIMASVKKMASKK
ncbi:MAG TPA: transketolase C-terminal domain-containing protein [Nitrospirota bacterium]|nr:transketolase C-terminal domain-containing protein [Nitrospirota bacterium]